VTASGEVRFVRVSREQRDALVAGDVLGERGQWTPVVRALVAAWDAAVPGVVDSSWAAQVRNLLARVTLNADVDFDQRPYLDAAYEIARAAAGGEATAGMPAWREPELARVQAEIGAAVSAFEDGDATADEAMEKLGVLASVLAYVVAGDPGHSDLADEPAGGEVAAVCHTSAPTGGVEKNDITTGGEAAVERSLSSRADAVWTVEDLPHLLDEQVERPSLSLRETIEAHDNRVRAYMEEHGWRRAINRMLWTHDDVRPLTFPFRDAIVKQVEREAEEGERDE
jgi:hypothetical protein